MIVVHKTLYEEESSAAVDNKCANDNREKCKLLCNSSDGVSSGIYLNYNIYAIHVKLLLIFGLQSARVECHTKHYFQ